MKFFTDEKKIETEMQELRFSMFWCRHEHLSRIKKICTIRQDPDSVGRYLKLNTQW
jgi:hypothetical protein